METNSNNMQSHNQDDEKHRRGELEENAFSQPQEYEDENGAGGRLGAQGDEAGTDEEEFGNDNPGGAGSAGSAATNNDDLK